MRLDLDVKNTLLSRIALKHSKWLKPLSIIIEILSIIIVVIVVWAILTASKSLLAIWALGSCNVTKPSACSLGAEVCSIDESEPTNALEATGRWFTEWGEIFEAIPEKFKTYSADDYEFNYITMSGVEVEGLDTVVDIFDPGCSVCMISYRNQKESGFFDTYNTRLVPYAIQDSDGNFKFKNSELIVKYMFAAEQVRSDVSLSILDKIFTGKNSEGISYQEKFNEDYSNEEALAKIDSWVKADGLDKGLIKKIHEIMNYPETTDKMNQNRDIVENQLKVKGIPTTLIDGKKHTGLWKNE